MARLLIPAIHLEHEPLLIRLVRAKRIGDRVHITYRWPGETGNGICQRKRRLTWSRERPTSEASAPRR